MNFEQRRIEHPQECIDDLLKLLAKQNAEIHGQIKNVKKVRDELAKVMTRLEFGINPPGTTEQKSFDGMGLEFASIEERTL